MTSLSIIPFYHSCFGLSTPKIPTWRDFTFYSFFARLSFIKKLTIPGKRAIMIAYKAKALPGKNRGVPLLYIGGNPRKPYRQE